MSVELKVNIINQLKLLKQSTFKDPLAFLDEDVQNAQRAKATEVRITTDSNKGTVIISNNGSVLTDAQKLFSVAESGWDADVVETENPFGMGFFSNIGVCNNIVIRTGNMLINFNANKMISSGDPTIPIETVDEYFEGFELTLEQFDFNEIYTSSIKERVNMLGKFVQDLDIVLNGTKVEHKDLTEITSSSAFAISIAEPSCDGWIALGSGFSSSLKLFYRGRLIKELSNLYYCEGELHLKPGVVDLTAPDRKDIIDNSKFSSFVSTIREYLELLATDAAITGTAAQQDKYAEAIEWYADVQRAKDTMKFTIVRCDDNGIKFLRDIIVAKDTKAFCAPSVALNTAATQNESHMEEVISVIEPLPAPVPTGTYYSSASGYGRTIIPDKNKVEDNGSTLFVGNRPKFWVSEKELAKYENKILICKHYDLCIVLAKNKFQSKVLASLEKANQVFHIKTLDERITVSSSLSNTLLSNTEQRAYMLLELLSKIVGHNYCVFAIGDLLVTRTLSIPEIGVEDTIIEDDVVSIFCKDAGKVYIDRTLLSNVKLLGRTDNKLIISDYKFIMSNLDTFAICLSYTCDKSALEVETEILKTLGGN